MFVHNKKAPYPLYSATSVYYNNNKKYYINYLASSSPLPCMMNSSLTSGLLNALSMVNSQEPTKRTIRMATQNIITTRNVYDKMNLSSIWYIVHYPFDGSRLIDSV